MAADSRARGDRRARSLRVGARRAGRGLTEHLASTPAAVDARGWGWRHAGRRAWALRGIDLTVEPGERMLLLGPSGSGKSTLLAALAGVLGGDEEGEAEGELRVAGHDPRAARGSAGLVLQDPESQLVMARVGDDVAFGCENLGVPRDELWPRVRWALDAVGLDVPLDHSTSALSGGQKQRLVLAGALAMRPGLLLLDEPTANLDPAGARDVRDAVAATLASTGATAIIVEHRVGLWLDLVDRVVVLGREGGVIADGTPDAVLSRHGAALAAQGVWVPGRTPTVSLFRNAGDQPTDHRYSGALFAEEGRDSCISEGAVGLLEARELAIARMPGRVVRDGIGLEVVAGEVLALTGPNGSGKSTLALTLAGLLPPAAGELQASPELADGAGPSPIRWRSRELLTRIGTVFQSPEHQFLATTVRDELAIGPRALGLPPAEVDARVDELLERLGLAALAPANPFTLSGGQQRRLSVATALATRPAVVVLDEPTFGQDALTWVSLVELLDRTRAHGSALVVATHDIPVIEALGGRELSLEAVTR